MDIDVIIMGIPALIILISFIGTIIVNRKKRRADELKAALDAALKPIKDEIAHRDELRKEELEASLKPIKAEIAHRDELRKEELEASLKPIKAEIAHRDKLQKEELEAALDVALKPIKAEIAHQDELRKAELALIELQVNNHLPTGIQELKDQVNNLSAKLDALIMRLIPKPKDTDE